MRFKSIFALVLLFTLTAVGCASAGASPPTKQNVLIVQGYQPTMNVLAQANMLEAIQFAYLGPVYDQGNKESDRSITLVERGAATQCRDVSVPICSIYTIKNARANNNYRNLYSIRNKFNRGIDIGSINRKVIASPEATI